MGEENLPLRTKYGPRRHYFPCVLYKMVNDPKTDPVISWGEAGRSFIICDPLEFDRDLLPKFMKHVPFSLFLRRLHTYGCKKIESPYSAAHFEYANDLFVRGKPNRALELQKRHMVAFGPANPRPRSKKTTAAALDAIMKQFMEHFPPGTFDFMPSFRDDPAAFRAHIDHACNQALAKPKDPLSASDKQLAATLMPALKDVIMRRKAFLMEALATAAPSREITH